ncbi:hypothetical protein GCM10010307_18900 [Streptomyces vastus]|uniref:Uncharacterized protein n=1 Tax=Streptomyces vastus TaxID=285451 RepID=A0ABP6CUK9_9ACTN
MDDGAHPVYGAHLHLDTKTGIVALDMSVQRPLGLGSAHNTLRCTSHESVNIPGSSGTQIVRTR